MNSKSRRVYSMLALGLAYALPAIEPHKPDRQPRKAAAEAKRQRKIAKRLARKEPK